jgi:lysozyme family protein
MNLEAMLTTLTHREGGYVDHPSDRGGPTCWGITGAVARAYGYTGDMQNLPLHVARGIYATRYWHQPSFDQVNDVSGLLAEELLDTGVNMGTGVAARFLQRALNVLGPYNLTADGAIGPMTLHALKEFLKRRGADGEKVLFAMLNAQQSVRYIELAEKDRSQMDFEYGWQRMRVVMP